MPTGIFKDPHHPKDVGTGVSFFQFYSLMQDIMKINRGTDKIISDLHDAQNQLTIS